MTYREIQENYLNCLLIARVTKREENGFAKEYEVLRKTKTYQAAKVVLEYYLENGFDDLMILSTFEREEDRLDVIPPEEVARSTRVYFNTDKPKGGSTIWMV